MSHFVEFPVMLLVGISKVCGPKREGIKIVCKQNRSFFRNSIFVGGKGGVRLRRSKKHIGYLVYQVYLLVRALRILIRLLNYFAFGGFVEKKVRNLVFFPEIGCLWKRVGGRNESLFSSKCVTRRFFIIDFDSSH